MVFHAGTRREGGRLLSNGGRVLNVTALGPRVAEAKERADAAIAQIDWPGRLSPHRHRLARHQRVNGIDGLDR